MKVLQLGKIGLILLGVLTVVTAVAFTTGSLGPQNQLFDDTGQKLTLTRPIFLQSARASMNQEIAYRLDEEAGISAWIDSGFPINLATAASAFKVIEDQTSEYIIGSVDLPNYVDRYNAHAYVHVDGYILAYYPRQEPASIMIRAKEQDITSTNLATIISIVASASGVPTSIINYYDFRYPNAKNILVVAETDNFTINIPSSFAYYERGFAIGGYHSAFNLDGTVLPIIYGANVYGSTYAAYGTISAAQLTPDITHNITIAGIGFLVITYTEP
jgi:hypothetical protein